MIILASHGHLASGMKDTLELILGEQKDLFAFDAYCNGIDSVKDLVKETISKHKPDTLVVLTDVVGGSVNNEMVQLSSEFPAMKLLSGMNTPLLLSILTSNGLEIDNSLKEAREGLVDVKSLLQNIEEDEL
ncbi:PTS sugar transporter subunit IIA [Streptococcus pluranimalium]|uniref:PTS sugar transporter subunit IIA n=1 Tax=Streptococcus pluranimalium TaxID=82348 RepID=UPI003BF85BCA